VTIASSTEISSLTGNKKFYDSSGSDITSTVLTDAVSRGDSDMMLYTGVTTWSVSDTAYPSAQEAAEYFGASFVLMRLAKNDNEFAKEAQGYFDQGVALCQLITQNSTAAIYISSKAYKSYPLNQNGTIHRSLPFGGDSTLEG